MTQDLSLGTITLIRIPLSPDLARVWQHLDGSRIPRATHPEFYDEMVATLGLGFTPHDPFAYLLGTSRPSPPLGWRVAVGGIEVPDWRGWAGDGYALFVYVGRARAQ